MAGNLAAPKLYKISVPSARAEKNSAAPANPRPHTSEVRKLHTRTREKAQGAGDKTKHVLKQIKNRCTRRTTIRKNFMCKCYGYMRAQQKLNQQYNIIIVHCIAAGPPARAGDNIVITTVFVKKMCTYLSPVRPGIRL